MEFYEALAEYYDRVFPPDGEIIEFLRGRFSGCAAVVDAACGTGTYTRALRESGRRTVGVDLDAKMIALAKSASPEPESDSDFFTADMRDLPSVLAGPFDGLFCIGNSLVHLPDSEEIGRTLRGFASVLAPGGKLVLQIINFDRIAAKGVRALPTLKAEGIEFVRRYEPGPDGDHVFFETELAIEYEGKRLFSRVPLFILRSGLLVRLLDEGGFGDIALYGSYSGEAYDPGESFLTIAEARQV